jgi:hypothetical protein
MTSTKNKKRTAKKTRSAKRAPAVVTEETTRVIAQPTALVTREPVTLSRVLGERVVAKPVTETEVTRTVRTSRKRGAA